jgi:hypothetical protein
LPTPEGEYYLNGMPVFSEEDDRLLGVIVHGIDLHVISRDDYEDPSVDLEERARELLGPGRYDDALDFQRGVLPPELREQDQPAG